MKSKNHRFCCYEKCASDNISYRFWHSLISYWSLRSFENGLNSNDKYVNYIQQSILEQIFFFIFDKVEGANWKNILQSSAPLRRTFSAWIVGKVDVCKFVWWAPTEFGVSLWEFNMVTGELACLRGATNCRHQTNHTPGAELTVRAT